MAALTEQSMELSQEDEEEDYCQSLSNPLQGESGFTYNDEMVML